MIIDRIPACRELVGLKPHFQDVKQMLLNGDVNNNYFRELHDQNNEPIGYFSDNILVFFFTIFAEIYCINKEIKKIDRFVKKKALKKPNYVPEFARKEILDMLKRQSEYENTDFGKDHDCGFGD